MIIQIISFLAVAITAILYFIFHETIGNFVAANQNILTMIFIVAYLTGYVFILTGAENRVFKIKNPVIKYAAYGVMGLIFILIILLLAWGPSGRTGGPRF